MGDHSVPSTAPRPLTCVECGQPWLFAYDVWRMYLTNDSPAEAVAYCPECATREFDP